jgi:hypoxanthine phosphoribosyltransferase
VAIETMIDEATLRARVREMGAQIRSDYGPETSVHLVSVLKGAFMFMADLMRAIEGPVTCDFIALSSYEGRSSSGEVRLQKDLDYVLQRRDVIVIEDIVDTGLTLSYLLEILRAREPKTLRTACLLSKPSRRKIEVKVDYIGFTIDSSSVTGWITTSNTETCPTSAWSKGRADCPIGVSTSSRRRTRATLSPVPRSKWRREDESPRWRWRRWPAER